MKPRPIPSHRPRPASGGYALLLVMISLAVLLVTFASVMYWTSTNARLTLRNNNFTSAEAAAESSTETILAAMMRDFNYGTLNSTSSYNTLAVPTNGWPIYYQFSDTNGNTAYNATVGIGNVPTSASVLNAQFAGLFGFIQPVVIASTATPKDVGQDLSATISQNIQFALIPLFQFAIFYNMDLEINPGAQMTINGHVHSNSKIWATGAGSSSLLVFSNAVDAAGTISNAPSPLDPQNTGRTGNTSYSTPGMPIPSFTSMSMPINGTTNNNPTNVLAILNAPPAAFAPPNYAAAYSTNGMNYIANAADLIISNRTAGVAGTGGTNLAVYYQNPNVTTPIQYVQPDAVVTLGVTNVVYAYSFVTNVAFYDYREGRTAQAVQIDVAKLNTWLTTAGSRGGVQYNTYNSTGTSSKGHGINSIFVANNVATSTSQFPALRMVNGSQLPASGLTVATAAPLYVKGDYNVTTNNGSLLSLLLGDVANTRPAALMGDAITILSTNWDDANTSSTSLGSRGAVNTTINAAALEGIVASNGSHYSGGVENFMRLLEDWNGKTLSYNGSIVVMFPSQYATNFWQSTGNYYNAPTRKWGFNVNFNTQSGLPPLTPTVKATIRGGWLAW